eukprot:340523-Pleurochrysis_carterae.AAC.1
MSQKALPLWLWSGPEDHPREQSSQTRQSIRQEGRTRREYENKTTSKKQSDRSRQQGVQGTTKLTAGGAGKATRKVRRKRSGGGHPNGGELVRKGHSTPALGEPSHQREGGTL